MNLLFRKHIDILILAMLVVFGLLHLGFSVLHVEDCFQLITFNIYAYVAKSVLFNPDALFSLNKGLANIVPCISIPLCYPPGTYFIVKLVSFVKNTQLTMHIFLLLLQIITILFAYITLRKVANKAISIVVTVFLIYYTASITLTVDNFIQPLLLIVVFILIAKSTDKVINLLMLGVFVGIIFFNRQNVGLFLTNVVITWLLLSDLSLEHDNSKKNRWFLWFVSFVYISLGFVLLKTIQSVADKIWYVLCYFVFWMMFLFYLYQNKGIGINLRGFIVKIGIFFVPLFLILFFWFYAFGNVIGIKKYLYLQFLMPFDFINVFEFDIVYHLQIAYEWFSKYMAEGTIKSMYYGVWNLMHWGPLFLLPFVFSCVSVGYVVIQLVSKKTISALDLQMASLPAAGILMFYPIESYWILSTKLGLFCISFLYFNNKIWGKNRRTIYIISLLFVLATVPLFMVRFVINIKNFHNGTYDSFIPINSNNKDEIRLPREKAVEVRKKIALIKSTVGNSKFYIIDSFNCLEMYYSLVDYKHTNYYIWMRGDMHNDNSVAAVIKTLKDYPFIVINQEDYLLYKDKNLLYLAGGKYGRSIPNKLMKYITKNYQVIAQYDKPKNITDIFISSFYILKKIKL